MNVLSRPSWARGLKLHERDASITPERSRPSWARGLKRRAAGGTCGASTVAPFMGAWIETGRRRRSGGSRTRVAPFMGAWIETVVRPRVRREDAVAPFMGAWIETTGLSMCGTVFFTTSRPSWARGLKLHANVEAAGLGQSRPSWARGLKLVAPVVDGALGDEVAPFMGAWIETMSRRSHCRISSCRALHGRVD